MLGIFCIAIIAAFLDTANGQFFGGPCPSLPQCHCKRISNPQLLSTDCSNRSLTHQPTIPRDTTHLNLRNNRIQRVTYFDLKQVVAILLDNNEINFIEHNAFQLLDNIRHISLTSNDLRIIDMQAFEFLTAKHDCWATPFEELRKDVLFPR